MEFSAATSLTASLRLAEMVTAALSAREQHIHSPLCLKKNRRKAEEREDEKAEKTPLASTEPLRYRNIENDYCYQIDLLPVLQQVLHIYIYIYI